MRQHRNRKSGTIRVLIISLALLAVLVQPNAQAYARDSLEYRVKAAFIYNFTKFVKWPDSAFSDATSPIRICILGDSPFGASLDAVAGKKAGGRRLVIYGARSVNDIEDCHVLFISSGSERDFFSSIERIEGRKILTIGDRQGIAKKGAVISFIMVSNRVQFEINTKSAERANLKISSQLLKIARIVDDE